MAILAVDFTPLKHVRHQYRQYRHADQCDGERQQDRQQQARSFLGRLRRFESSFRRDTQ
jgi:hypothetical protein